MKKQWGIVLGILLWALTGATLQAQTNNNSGTSSQEPVEYVIENMIGSNVQVEVANSNVWKSAQEGQVLESGDEIRVGDNCQATLTMQSGTDVHLYANTDVKVDQIEPNSTNGFLSRLIIFTGTILSDVEKNLMESHSSFEVEASGVVCSVRGTAFEVSDVNGQVVTATHEGDVETVQQGQIHYVKAGMALSYRRGRFMGYRRLTRLEMNRFRTWRMLRRRIRVMRFRRLREMRSGRSRIWSRRQGQSGRRRR